MKTLRQRFHKFQTCCYLFIWNLMAIVVLNWAKNIFNTINILFIIFNCICNDWANYHKCKCGSEISTKEWKLHNIESAHVYIKNITWAYLILHKPCHDCDILHVCLNVPFFVVGIINCSYESFSVPLKSGEFVVFG